MMQDRGYENAERILMPFDTLFKAYVDESKLSATDFMVRIELAYILAATKKKDICALITEEWNVLFPEIPQSCEVAMNARIYMKQERLAMKILSENGTIQSGEIRFRASVLATVLMGITGNEIVTRELYWRTVDELKGAGRENHASCTRTSDVLMQMSCPSGKKIMVADHTLALLQRYRNAIVQLLDEIKTPSRHNSVRSQRPVLQQGSTEKNVDEWKKFKPTTAVQFARIVCMIEACLAEGEGKNQWDALLSKYWHIAYDDIPCSEKNRKSFFDFVHKDIYLDGLAFLFLHSIGDVRNARITRIIAVTRAVHNVLAHVPRAQTNEELQESSFHVYSQFNVVSDGHEEEDLPKYISRFLTEEGMLDVQAMAIMREYRSTISNNCKKAIEGLAQSRARNYYVETLRSQNERQVAELQEQAAGSRFAALSSLVETLSGSTYGFLLGKIFRIAYGYDTPDTESMQTLCRDILQVLRLFNIKPIGENLIGKSYMLVDRNECRLTMERYTGYSDTDVVYPGWQVEDDAVAWPIATMDETEEDVEEEY